MTDLNVYRTDDMAHPLASLTSNGENSCPGPDEPVTATIPSAETELLFEAVNSINNGCRDWLTWEWIEGSVVKSYGHNNDVINAGNGCEKPCVEGTAAQDGPYCSIQNKPPGDLILSRTISLATSGLPTTQDPLVSRYVTLKLQAHSHDDDNATKITLSLTIPPVCRCDYVKTTTTPCDLVDDATGGPGTWTVTTHYAKAPSPDCTNGPPNCDPLVEPCPPDCAPFSKATGCAEPFKIGLPCAPYCGFTLDSKAPQISPWIYPVSPDGSNGWYKSIPFVGAEFYDYGAGDTGKGDRFYGAGFDKHP